MASDNQPTLPIGTDRASQFLGEEKVMRYLLRIFLLTVVLNATALHGVASASIIVTQQPPLQVSLNLFAPPFVACLTGFPCEAPWASQNLPILPADVPLFISINSTDFNFTLGSNLSGLYKASLSSTYLTGSFSEELFANIASSQAVLGITANGEFTFAATNGDPLYLLLSGRVRGGKTYTLLVTAVPEPGQYLLLIIGLGMLAFQRSRRSRQ